MAQLLGGQLSLEPVGSGTKQWQQQWQGTSKHSTITELSPPVFCVACNLGQVSERGTLRREGRDLLTIWHRESKLIRIFLLEI